MMKDKIVISMLIFTTLAISFAVYQSVYVPYKHVENMCENPRMYSRDTKQQAKDRCLFIGYERLKHGHSK